MKILCLALLVLGALAPLSTRGTEIAQYKFDGTTEHATSNSLTHILLTLSRNERDEFLEALKRIQFDNLRSQKPVPLGQKINGMTYREIEEFSKTLPPMPEVPTH